MSLDVIAETSCQQHPFVSPEGKKRPWTDDEQPSAAMALAQPRHSNDGNNDGEQDNDELHQQQQDNNPHYPPDTASVTTATSTTTAAVRYTTPTVSLRDIIGHGAVKLRLDELLLPLALPAAVTAAVWTGLRATTLPAVLLFGPPGCGKTQLAAAVAGEAGAAFLTVGPADILSKFVGESEAAVRAVFGSAAAAARACRSRTAVVFWDEIDALGTSRGGGSGGAAAAGDAEGCGRRILAELLLQFNALSQPQETSSSSSESPPRILMLAATNRPEDCDPALLRRFGMRLYVGCPDAADRRKLVKRYLRDVDHTLTTRCRRQVAAATEGWSGSELEHLTREAVMAPVRECLQVAAKQRRRKRVKRQPSSVSTARDPATTTTDDDEDDDATEQARQTLLQSLETLRPVTVQDFANAIGFILSQTSPSAETEANVAQRYDSSSSSEDEEDVIDDDDKLGMKEETG